MAVVTNVLLVDDSESCLATLDVALEKIPDIVVHPARSAEAALEMLALEPVNAIITDIHLPAMTGLELISKVRSEPKFRSLPILVVSADADPGAPRAALEAGADAYFAKPFSPGAVRRKLEDLIHAQRAISS